MPKKGKHERSNLVLDVIWAEPLDYWLDRRGPWLLDTLLEFNGQPSLIRRHWESVESHGLTWCSCHATDMISIMRLNDEIATIGVVNAKKQRYIVHFAMVKDQTNRGRTGVRSHVPLLLGLALVPGTVA